MNYINSQATVPAQYTCRKDATALGLLVYKLCRLCSVRMCNYYLMVGNLDILQAYVYKASQISETSFTSTLGINDKHNDNLIL